MTASTVQDRLSSILVPLLISIGMIAYFAALFNLAIPPGAIPSALRNFIMPVVFAFPWILFAFIFRERIINAWNSMKSKTSIIPLRWRMLYGFNTVIILALFLFPFISPPLAIFASLVLAWRLVVSNESIWKRGSKVQGIYTLFLFIIIAILPTYLLIIWFQYYLGSIAANILLTWVLLFDPIYFASLCIVNALSVGALLHLSYGTLDVEGLLNAEKTRTVWSIRFLEFVIFTILFLFFNPWFQPFGITFWQYNPLGIAGRFGFITYINYVALALVFMVYIVKFCVGIGKGFKLSILGVLLAASFLVIEVVTTIVPPYDPLRVMLVVGSSLLFIIAFTLSFFAASDRLEVMNEIEVEEELASLEADAGEEIEDKA